MRTRDIGLAVMALGAVSVLASTAWGGEPRSVYEAHVYKDAGGGTLPYRLLRPAGYDASKRYPLVVFFHGAGERGDDNVAQLAHCAEAFLRAGNREKYPCFVLFPQCAKEARWVEAPWDKPEVAQPKEPSAGMRMTMEVVEELEKKFSIDERRIYVSGLSMGGFGTWDAITRWPEKFAAAVPICGGGDVRQAVRAAKVPVWAFHSADDPVVNVVLTRRMVEALQKAGGKPKYTEYNGLGHNSWTKAYEEPELFAWMFGQAKAESGK